MRILHPFLPPDYTPEEYEIVMYCVSDVYRHLEDPIDKFIVAFVFELGYKQDLAAKALQVSDSTISLRIKSIRAKLAKRLHKNIRSEKS